MITIPLIPNKKYPYLKNWQKITKSKTIHEGENVGALTGKVSNITVIDIDKKDNGIITWNKLISCYPEFKTATVKTPFGGIHVYFKYNKKLKSSIKLKINNKLIGWDVLNDGKQAVLPPSVVDGKKYKWIIREPIITMPKWLEEYILMNQR